MTTNGEWLFSKPFDEQVAWTHEEHQDGTLDGDAAVLNAKIAELELQLEEHREGWNHAIDGWQKAGKRVDELLTHMEKLTAERDELKGQVFTLKCECDDLENTCDDLENERDNLAADLAECEAERERYRNKFGKCLDYADAIHALMDDEGLA